MIAPHSARIFVGDVRQSQPPGAPKNLADGAAMRPYHAKMTRDVAIIGAGVSGLTCAAIFAERGYRTAIFAKETGQCTTSGAAAALWFPYDAEPAEKVIAWALETFEELVDLSREPCSGVSMIELRSFSRTGEIQIPDWAHPLGARRLQLSTVAAGLPSVLDGPQRRGYNPGFPASLRSGFAITVPLMDTTIYLNYLEE